MFSWFGFKQILQEKGDQRPHSNFVAGTKGNYLHSSKLCEAGTQMAGPSQEPQLLGIARVVQDSEWVAVWDNRIWFSCVGSSMMISTGEAAISPALPGSV